MTRWVVAGQLDRNRNSRYSLTLAKLIAPLMKGALQTELGLAQVGGQPDKEEEQHTEWYFDQVVVNFGSNVRESKENNS